MMRARFAKAWRLLPVAVLLSALGTGPAAAASLDEAVAALKPGGLVLLMRHAQTTPGVGDPEGYTLDNCASQRNLNDEGKAQSRALGEKLAASGVEVGRTLSSVWCRSVDTARLILESAGQTEVVVERYEPLNSTWDERGASEARATAVRKTISEWRGPGNLLMVSHGVNISAIIGRAPPQGGFAVVAPTPDGLRVVIEARP
ncbi:MAG: histidine phosphatase family protein [Pseudomonadota bacterium]